MRKILISMMVAVSLVGFCQAQDIGLSFFKTTNKTNDISFGVTFDMLWLTKKIAIGADWSVFNSGKSKNLIGWCVRFHLGKNNKIAVPIGFDFNNQRFYIGFGGKF